jgi:PD-(D/E)XK nuclease superfamily protein
MSNLIQFPHVIDNSMRKELVKCEMAAHYKYEMGLRANEQSRVDLHAGKSFAKAMEVMRLAYYRDALSPYDALQQGIAAVYAAYGSFEPPAKSNKTAGRMAGALAYYAQECPLADEELTPIRFGDQLGIEVSFDYSIPIAHPDTGVDLRYAGRFDMAALDISNRAWVVDEKTTSQMGDKWANQWPLDSQMTGYCWGLQRKLQEHNLPYEVAGAVINGIAIRLRDYEHGRFETQRQDWEIDRWYRQMLSDIARWKYAYQDRHHDQALDHACAQYNNPCEFMPLCKSRNPERLIDGSYTVEWWNPLERSK